MDSFEAMKQMGMKAQSDTEDTWDKEPDWVQSAVLAVQPLKPLNWKPKPIIDLDEYLKWPECPTCEGRGETGNNANQECPTCQGCGRVKPKGEIK